VGEDGTLRSDGSATDVFILEPSLYADGGDGLYEEFVAEGGDDLEGAQEGMTGSACD
jgi:hypothetical protein